VRIGRFLADAVDGTLREGGEALERKLHSLPGAHEQRQDEVGDVETGLADERAQGGGATKAPQARKRKDGCHASLAFGSLP
jgi:hypothetical protein